jgi:hypothetical protein
VAHDEGAEAKVAAAVALTAAVFSPRVRDLLRRGAVHGLAGVLTAGDALLSFARGVSRGVQTSTVPGTRAEPAPANALLDRAPVGAAASEGTVASDPAPRPPRRARRRPPADPQARSGAAATPPPAATMAPAAAAGDAPHE